MAGDNSISASLDCSCGHSGQISLGGNCKCPSGQMLPRNPPDAVPYLVCCSLQFADILQPSLIYPISRHIQINHTNREMIYNIFVSEEKKQPVGQQLNINLDQTPILYTDNIMITSNDDGVVFDFCQRLGNTPQARVVARIGMSPTHAKKFLIALKDQFDKNSKTGQTGNRAVN